MSTKKIKRLAATSKKRARADKINMSLDLRWWWKETGDQTASAVGPTAMLGVTLEQPLKEPSAFLRADRAELGAAFLYELVRRLPEAKARLPHFAWPPYPELHLIEKKRLFRAAFGLARWRPAAFALSEGLLAEHLKPETMGYAAITDGWLFDLRAHEEEIIRVIRERLMVARREQGIERKTGTKECATRNLRGKQKFDWSEIELLDHKPGSRPRPLSEAENKRNSTLRKLGRKHLAEVCTALSGNETAKLELLVDCLRAHRFLPSQESPRLPNDLLDELLLAAHSLQFKKPIADYQLGLPSKPQSPDDPAALGQLLKEHFAEAYDEDVVERLANALRRIRGKATQGSVQRI